MIRGLAYYAMNTNTVEKQHFYFGNFTEFMMDFYGCDIDNLSRKGLDNYLNKYFLKASYFLVDAIGVDPIHLYEIHLPARQQLEDDWLNGNGHSAYQVSVYNTITKQKSDMPFSSIKPLLPKDSLWIGVGNLQSPKVDDDDLMVAVMAEEDDEKDNLLKDILSVKSHHKKGNTMSDGGLGVLNKRTPVNNGALKSALSEGKKSMSVNTIGTELIGQNKEAARLAAELEVGKTATNIVTAKLKGNLPAAIEMYSDHPLFSIAVANATAGAIKHFVPTNVKANMLADAMVQAAMVEMVSSFEVGKMVEELINGVDLSALSVGSEKE